MKGCIDSESGIDIAELTFSKLRNLYGTGRSYYISGSGRDRKFGYRKGVMTEIGDIEISVWEGLVRKLIARAGEENLHKNLLSWCTENVLFLRSESERKSYALDLHAMRIFDDLKWVDYVAFNDRYRPEKLK